jgi:hypothetical protein
MAQAGYTPIQLYYSTTASAVPTAGNLSPGELALNINDMKLYCENSSGVVTLLASAAGSSGDVVGPASATDTAVALFDGTTGKLLKNSAVTVGTTGNTVISGTDNSNAMLRITQLGTGNALLVEDSANPDSTPFVINASGEVGIGTTTPQSGALLTVAGASTFGRTGTVGYTQMIGGTANNTGYVGFFTAADVRQAYIGYIGAPNDALNIETDSGSNKPVRISTNAATRITVAATGATTFDSQILLNQDYIEKRFTANSGTAITLDLANGTMQDITLTGTATITMPTAVAGKSFILLLRSGAGSYGVTWTTVKWPGGTAPTVTTTASRLDIYSFFSDGTNWYGITVSQNYTP